MTQFPFRAEVRFRSTRHEGPNGGEISYADPDFEERSWDVALEELTDAEWAAVEELFQQAGGRLGGFTFLDPTANLLVWSEGLDEAVWSVTGAGLQAGVADPLGGTGATTLTTGGGGGALAQTIAAPATYRYAGSMWARTTASGVALRVGDGQGSQRLEPFKQDGVWRRYVALYGGEGSGETMRFEIVAPAGASVDVFGPQFEAQATASEYKRSGERSGVHPNARFDQDALIDRASGLNRHSTRLRIVWTPSPT